MERDILLWLKQHMGDKANIERPEMVYNLDTGHEELWFEWDDEEYVITLKRSNAR